MTKSFVGPAFLAWILYYVGFWIIGLIVNLLYLGEARRIRKEIGVEPSGSGCLVFLLIVHLFIPLFGLIFVVLVIVGAASMPHCVGGTSSSDGASSVGGTGVPDDAPTEPDDRAGRRSGGGTQEREGRGPLSLSTWVTIEPARFQMGSPASEPGRGDNEYQHAVTLTHRFEILATEVTQGQFEARMGYNPSFFSGCGADCPVERVSWHEAAAYCNALSATPAVARCYSCSGAAPAVTCSLSPAYVFTVPGPVRRGRRRGCGADRVAA